MDGGDVDVDIDLDVNVVVFVVVVVVVFVVVLGTGGLLPASSELLVKTSNERQESDLLVCATEIGLLRRIRWSFSFVSLGRSLDVNKNRKNIVLKLLTQPSLRTFGKQVLNLRSKTNSSCPTCALPQRSSASG